MTFFAKRDDLVEEANKRLRLPVPRFALKDRREVIDKLMQEPELVDYIESEAAGKQDVIDTLSKQARRYAAEIGPKFSPLFYFRIAFYLARAWMRLHYKVQTVASDEAGFQEIPADATIIIVCNHRSNFDPLVITYLALRYSTIGLSAGEWARLWPLHHFVRAAGGFVVDRSADDPLYRRVLAAYVRLYVASGVHQGFFPEGELSRDGRISEPKLGFLNFYCRACSEDRDIVFIPAGINYDRIPEDRRLVQAMGSFENPKATFLIVSSLRYLASVLTLPFRRRSRRYGNACVGFGTAISLQTWLAGKGIEITDLAKPGRYDWLPDFANALMKACGQQVPAPPVAVLATVICDAPDRVAWSLDELKRGTMALIQQLESNDANIFQPGGIDADVGFAVDLLMHKKLIDRDKNGNYSAVASRLPLLRHYANSIGHLVR